MGCSDTDQHKYRNADPQSEKHVDKDAWDRAEDFWVGLAGESQDFAPVRKALTMLVTDHGGGRPDPDEKIVVIWKAWNAYKMVAPGAKFKVHEKDLRPNYTIHKDADGNVTDRILKDKWDFGGVDLLPTLDRERAEKEARTRGDAPAADATANEAGPPDAGAPADELVTDDGGGSDDVSGDEFAVQDGDDVVLEPTEEEIRQDAEEIREDVPEDETPAQERVRRSRMERTAAGA
jgi:hypothetical protein